MDINTNKLYIVTRKLDEGFENWGIFASYDEAKNAINQYAKKKHAIIENKTENIFKVTRHETCKDLNCYKSGYGVALTLTIRTAPFGHLVESQY